MRMRIREVLNTTPVLEKDVTVFGWVRTRRDSKGGFSFIELNDGSCFGNLQIVAPATLPNYTTELMKVYVGASLKVEGRLVPSQGKGQTAEVQAHAITVLGYADPTDYPLQKQKMSMEYLREVAHLRPRTNTFGAVTRLRDTLAAATHEFFRQRGFFWVHTPLITASDCEGAGAMFQVTTLDLNKPLPRIPETNAVDYTKDFFGRKANLTVSGQLEGETYACAMGDIYTFGPTFRAENSNTRRHLSEFWMIEPEMAFADIHDDAELAQDLLRHYFQSVLKYSRDDLNFFNLRIDPTLLARLENLAEAKFTKIEYTEAIEVLQKSGASFEFPVTWGIDLQSEHERYLTEEIFKGPVVVVNYPKEIKSFYMRQNDDQKTVAAMDVLLPQVGEIIGGSQREDRLDVLVARMKELNLDPAGYKWYLDLRRFGSVPHAGFGLGFERIVQFCSGMHNIRDVIPFPRAPGTCDF